LADGAEEADMSRGTPGAEPGFVTAPTRALRRAGLAGGSAAVAFAGEAVQIVGEAGGSLAIPIQEVETLRAGMAGSKRRVHYECRLWRRGDAAPLRLDPAAQPPEELRYAAFCRALAGALEGSGRIGAVETGVTRGWAALMIALGALVTLAFAASWLFVLQEDEQRLGVPRAVAAAFPALFTLASAAFVYWAWSRHWPRRIASLAELERVLPR
jgi:hypothetical protein